MNELIDVRGGAGLVDSYRPRGSTKNESVRRLLAERPPLGDGEFGCYLIADTSRYSDLARRVECAVFQEFFGNDPSIMAEAYAPYESHSIFFLVVDRKLQQAAGALRIISHSERGLKTLSDIAEAPLSLSSAKVRELHGIKDLSTCWDVGTLAVLKQYRGRATGNLVSTTLYGLFYAEVRKRAIEHVVTVLDGHAYQQLTEWFGIPFVPIANSEPFNYLGSENSRAAYMHVPSIHPIVAAHMDKLDESVRGLLMPHLARMLYGEGLPDIVEVP